MSAESNDDVTTPGRRRPSRSRGDQQEIALLDSAQRLLTAMTPLAEITIERIASGAGLSRPSVYFYFDSKEAILRAVLQRLTRTLSAEIRDQPGRTFADTLDTFLEVVSHTWRTQPALVCAAFELAVRDAAFRQSWQDYFLNCGEVLVIAAERDQAAGLLPNFGATRPALIALCFMYERNCYLLFSREHQPEEEDELFALLRGLFRRAVGAAG
ncbi:TetR/AcrR family transcriptional regulator [Prauserella cavernicola]|uniref:TetR/AcrR family transcriptional regulator n=1 Tax=Prauserella cavernicola TaxID=2800127 RepID=A0A934V3D2_9PSEU|nr:TetR/AcrR family transcriptional regulator [Prauserella cavernicola]MBK1787151.1 TetR/AcrR family transcriptional regulator [Prauserella cavernicola]